MYELQSDILILEPLAKLNLNLGFFRIFGLLSEKKQNKKEFGNFWEYGFALKWNSQSKLGYKFLFSLCFILWV